EASGHNGTGWSTRRRRRICLRGSIAPHRRTLRAIVVAAESDISGSKAIAFGEPPVIAEPETSSQQTLASTSPLRVILLTHGGAEDVLALLSFPEVQVVGVFVETEI